MNQTTVAQALEWITEPAGTCDRPALLDYLNSARERFYLLYEEIALFELTECFEVQEFCADCRDARSTRYRGVTLPREYQSPEAIWFNDLPLHMFSSWREWQQGLTPECACNIAKYDVPGNFSSERDILPGRSARLRVSATHAADVGKQVFLRGVDMFGAEVAKPMTLSLDGTYTDAPMCALAHGGGFSKPRTEGSVILSEENGRVLSVYAPDETVPGYRRIKLTGLRDCDARVNIRGNRRYFPVYRDSDIVELDIKTAFEEMVRFLRLNSKANKTGEDMRAMGGHFEQAKAALKGDKARDLGKTTQMRLRIESCGFGPRRIGGW